MINMDEENVEKTVPEIVEEIKRGDLNPKLLSNDVLDLIIEHLHFEKGESQHVVASLLKRNRLTILNHAKKILKAKAEELKVRGTDVYELAQRLTWHTHMTMCKAKDKDDWRLYIDVYHRYLERLQSLGVIYKAPTQIEMHTLNGGEIEEIKSFILNTLEPFPEARFALASAFREEAKRSELGNGK